MTAEVDALKRAFPAALRHDLTTASVKVDLNADYPPARPFTAHVAGEVVEIPSRVYFTSLGPVQRNDLTPAERELINLLYTRHHNGFVRESALKCVVQVPRPWVCPFVVHLCGEYVVEILHEIERRLVILDRTMYAEFLANNAVLWSLTKQRVASYWNCYYRQQFAWHDYVGFRIVRFLERL
jgi:hypothetical protein